MATSTKAVTVRQLSKAFVTEEGRRVPVLDGLDLSIASGEFVTLLGPTGCGKTTLLRLLLGLERATSGEVLVAGKSPWNGTAAAGSVFQQHSLLPWRKVIRNVTFPLELKGMKRKQAVKEAMELLHAVGLAKEARSYPHELSGGMQQRAAIARALAFGAEILFMDEPFGALDDRTRRILEGFLLQIREERGLTILFVTHNIEEALLLGTRVLVMGKGRILQEIAVSLPRPRDPLSGDFSSLFLKLRGTFASAVSDDEHGFC